MSQSGWLAWKWTNQPLQVALVGQASALFLIAFSST
jgi:hypothetical protein